MSNFFSLMVSFVAGFALGVFFFGSLWITVRQLSTIQQPVRLVIGSLLGRLTITLLGFYLIMDGHWERALVGLVGFVIARMALVRQIQPKPLQMQSLRGK